MPPGLTPLERTARITVQGAKGVTPLGAVPAVLISRRREDHGKGQDRPEAPWSVVSVLQLNQANR